MLNYISAELYKLRFHKGLYAGVFLLLFLESWVFFPFMWQAPELSMSREVLYGFLIVALNVGLFIVPIIAVMVFDDQHGNGTTKNEIVYGIPRARVYLGKLAAALLAGTAVAVLAEAWYLLLTFLVGRPGEYGAVMFHATLRVVLIHWWVWAALLAYCFFLLFTLKSAAAALVVSYLTTICATPIALTVAGSGGEGMKLWVRVACELFYAAPLRVSFGTDASVSGGGLLLPLLGGNILLYSIVVGLVWLVGVTGLGLFIFHRREIR